MDSSDDALPDDDERLTFWVDFVAGWCAGAAGVVLVQPVDTLLTRYQAGLQPNVWSKTTIAKTSPQSLYRGAWPMIWTVPLQNMLLMGGYGLGQSYYESQHNATEQHNFAQKYTSIFVCGSLGGVTQSFLMSPVELVKIQRQCVPQMASAGTAAASLTSPTTASASLTVWKVPARGLGATLLRDGIPHGVWFVSYQWCKDIMEQQHPERFGPVATSLTSGAVAATIAWAVGYPADLVKTRIQATTTTTGSDQGILETTRQIIRETGSWRGLYKGFGWKLVRAIPASMVGFGVYEMVKQQVLDCL